MKISNQKTSHKKRNLLIVTVIFVLLGGGVVYAIYTNNQNQTDKNNPTQVNPVDSAKEADFNATKKEEFIEKEMKNESSESEKVTDSDISLGVEDQGDNAVITTNLASVTAGTCKLVIKNGSQTYSETVDIIYAPEYSICAGFTVPKSKLGSGTWNIDLEVTSGTQILTKTIQHNL